MKSLQEEVDAGDKTHDTDSPSFGHGDGRRARHAADGLRQQRRCRPAAHRDPQPFQPGRHDQRWQCLPRNTAAQGHSRRCTEGGIERSRCHRPIPQGANGRILGRIDGLRVGANTLAATAAGSARARLDITNHGRGDSIFAGPQTQPWICATRNGAQATVSVPGTALSATVTTRASGLDTDPVDALCNTRTQYTYYYMPKSRQGSACTPATTSTAPCHLAFDPSQRPADSEIADFTNDRGDTVKHLLRVETGVMGRGTYQILA